MTRQHTKPILIPSDGAAVCLTPISKSGGEGAILEGLIQELVHAHPACLPIFEIDPAFVNPIPICRELVTPAGLIDNFLITPTGLPILVECKLWRNAEARRDVVTQILDYAKELALLNASELQRSVGRRLKDDAGAMLRIVRERHPDVDETDFNDALSNNLRRGRFLLLIVGDGIREGVENIVAYLEKHAGLHFSLGLVELPIYDLPDDKGRIVVPRVLAHTHVITRTVVSLPDGYTLEHGDNELETDKEIDPETVALGDSRQAFWVGFLQGLRLDDPEQPIPRAPRQGYLSLSLPAPGGSSWITVYRDLSKGEVGIFLSSYRNSPGEYAAELIAEDWADLRPLIGGTARLEQSKGRSTIADRRKFGALDEPAIREDAFAWLRERANTFVNALRPRVRSAVADYQRTQSATDAS